MRRSRLDSEMSGVRGGENGVEMVRAEVVYLRVSCVVCEVLPQSLSARRLSHYRFFFPTDKHTNAV